MSKQIQKEFDSNFLDFESLAGSLLDALCQLHGVLFVISLLKDLGYTRAEIQYLQFDDVNISEVFDKP